jgi:hypothetical protein
VGEIITHLGKTKNPYWDLFAIYEWEEDFGSG